MITLASVEHYGYADYPSGQLRSTATDLAKFMATYLNEGIFNGTSILETETIELIKSIQYPNINNQQGIIWYYKILNGRIQANKKYSINSTPTIIINEKKLEGSASFKNIKKKIEKLI